MKVNSANGQKREPNKLKQSDEIRDKLKEKFGDQFLSAAEKNKVFEEDSKVELKSKGKSQAQNPDMMLTGDVGKNDPKSVVTQAKLKDLLSSGGFEFNPKERAALQEILNK